MTTSRNDSRQVFIDAWHKQTSNLPLSTLEQLIVAIIEKHPEYINTLESNDCLTQNYHTDNNPFLHLGLHLSLQEQLNTNRPQGINAVFTQLCQQHQDQHQVEHLMMDVMATILWDAQQQGILPCETTYLQQLQKLI